MEPTVEPAEKSNNLKRWGPLVAILVVVALVAAIVVVTSGGDDDSEDSGDQAGSGVTIENAQGESIELPDGVLPFDVAEAEGIDVDWPDTCDTDRGTAAVPTYFAPVCYAQFEGDNGGETDQGVTEDTIKVVLYQGPDDDPIIDAIAGAVSDDTNADTLETYQGYMDYFETYYETYGRKVELIPYQGTGTALDEVAARADAVQIATEIEPFAVWGAPALTNAFADELAAQHITHLGLAGGGQQPDYYAERDPYLIQVAMGTNQARQHASAYICGRLAGKPAEHAGDEALQDQERKFGLIYISTGPESAQTVTDFEDGLAECDVELAAVESYSNPLDVSAVAPSVIAKMKDSGVTSVIVTGDPLTPATWTETATEQDYFPEWVVAGAPLVDTAIFSRTYDQEQWAHAFGMTAGSARQDPEVASSRALYTWFNCNPPAADDTVELVYGSPAVFYAALQGVGPNLTRENFRNALFAGDPTPRGITNPSLSWGEPSKGRWDDVDYQGIDDATEIWWNSDVSGPDESGTEGQGLWVYSDGGKRYLVDEWGDSESKAFDEEGGVTIYEDPPADETFPEYPEPCSGDSDSSDTSADEEG
jgi:hypothetical protein